MSWIAMGPALWLGILTSISPCPLASNIAAISFVGRRVGRTGHVLASGLLYTLGRTVTYLALAVAILAGLLASDEVARFLQRYMNQILGPVLVLVGMFLLGLLGSGLSVSIAGRGVQERASGGGIWWAAALGVVFALSFCPLSAGLFFFGLVPLAAAHNSRVVLPSLYGVGTALPVVAFALLMAFGAQHVGKAFDRLTQVERWARRITGVVFVLAGIYYCLAYIYGLPITVW